MLHNFIGFIIVILLAFIAWVINVPEPTKKKAHVKFSDFVEERIIDKAGSKHDRKIKMNA